MSIVTGGGGRGGCICGIYGVHCSLYVRLPWQPPSGGPVVTTPFAVQASLETAHGRRSKRRWRVLASGVRQADPIRKATRKPLDQMPSVNSPKLTEPEIESLASGARAKDCFVRQTRSFSSDLRHQDTVVSWDPASLASCVRLPLVGCTVVP